ncbi:immunoglobulin-like domain-containing protein [Bacillaceae bacterium W0354]
MTVVEGTVSPTGLTVLIEINSDKQCIYGEYFMLEKKIEGEWYQVPIEFEDNYGFNDIGYELNPSDIGEWIVDWDWLYGSLDPGEYRIVKDISDFREPGDYDKYNLAAEFTVD